MILRAATLTLVGGTVTALILSGHHAHKRPERGSAVAPVIPLRNVSRGEVRKPLPVHRTPVKHRQRPHLRLVESRVADTTMYCSTGNRTASGSWPEVGDVAVLDRTIPFGTRVRIFGNVYIVRDWIGSGSDFDLFGGNDAGCERRALRFGRHRAVVEVER